MDNQLYGQYHTKATGSPAPHASVDKIETQKTHPVPNSKESGLDSEDSISPLAERTATASSKHHHLRAALGLARKAPINQEHDEGDHHQNLWPRIRLVLREPLAEFWGVFIMVMFGDGSVAQVLLSTGSTDAPGGNGRRIKPTPEEN